MATVNEELLDAAVSHQIGLQRYSTATVNKIIALLNRVDGDLVRQIMKFDPTEVGDSAARKRLDKLLEAVRVILRDAYNGVGKELRAELIDLAGYEVEYQADLFNNVLPIEYDVVKPSPEILKAAVDSRPFQGALLKEWVKGLEEGANRRLRDAIRIGVVEGETIDQIVRRVRGTKTAGYKDSILETSRRSAEAMVRTAVNHVATRAREDLYEANKDLVKGVMWISTIDSRTSAICRARDRKVYEPGKGPRPPGHINCRSTTVPVTKSWKELGINLPEAPVGTRASMDGQIAADLTYSDWLRKKPASFQDEILGKTKAKLFRDGEISLDRFVDKTGREYTLDELRRREKAAFEKAGLAA